MEKSNTLYAQLQPLKSDLNAPKIQVYLAFYPSQSKPRLLGTLDCKNACEPLKFDLLESDKMGRYKILFKFIFENKEELILEQLAFLK
ncbi:hypothetical protein HPSA50_1765 [Helicobacter pylori SouthAfrica50]|uniref:Uncharacterized protein n=1 Tax=Helicobacter pylori SouthAfrica50 TaxID=1352357 RepID=T2SD64_HELPX|nr:hypothetical protein HPSA50_1765 [Helicobacter pylori SouthAfrica50]